MITFQQKKKEMIQRKLSGINPQRFSFLYSKKKKKMPKRFPQNDPSGHAIHSQYPNRHESDRPLKWCFYFFISTESLFQSSLVREMSQRKSEEKSNWTVSSTNYGCDSCAPNAYAWCIEIARILHRISNKCDEQWTLSNWMLNKRVPEMQNNACMQNYDEYFSNKSKRHTKTHTKPNR